MDVVVIKRWIWKRKLDFVIWYSKYSARKILIYLSSGFSISISKRWQQEYSGLQSPKWLTLI